MSDEAIRQYARALERSGVSVVDIAMGLVRFYRLHWVTYDINFESWFVSSLRLTEGEFEAVCDSLVLDASRKAVDKANGRDQSQLVGWCEIVYEIAELLNERGFRQLTPVTCRYSGSMIIDDEEDRKSSRQVSAPDFVLEHNRQAEEQMRG